MWTHSSQAFVRLLRTCTCTILVHLCNVPRTAHAPEPTRRPARRAEQRDEYAGGGGEAFAPRDRQVERQLRDAPARSSSGEGPVSVYHSYCTLLYSYFIARTSIIVQVRVYKFRAS